MARPREISNWTGWDGVGFAGLDPKSEFALDLLKGRAPEIGVFVTKQNEDSRKSAEGPFYDFNAGEITIG